MGSIGGYEKFPFPKHREMLGDLASLVPTHSMQGLAEFDVTRARTYMRKHKEETGETLSFTGWLIKCIGQAVSEYKHVQAYRRGKSLIVFDDVDVGFTMEQESQGQRIVAGYIVRKADKKSLREIHEEIRVAQKMKGIHGALVGDRDDARTFGSIQSMPRILRKFAIWKFRRDPFLRKRTQGTVGITSVGGMSGDVWGCPIVSGPYPLFLGIGSISKKPGLVDDRIEPREYLTMSVMFDHDAVDGAAAARFTGRLGELLKEGYGLEEDQ
jgi:pyruvate/2-oxoglutarate dehydrogenase complex dihydrolipoamide acyltransferase (E2) component